MNWNRLAEKRLRELADQFPAVVVVGPRQVGKTTLARTSFPEASYKDVESPLVHLRFTEDPAHELELLGNMTILDEAQTVPSLFSALRPRTAFQKSGPWKLLIHGRVAFVSDQQFDRESVTPPLCSN